MNLKSLLLLWYYPPGTDKIKKKKTSAHAAPAGIKILHLQNWPDTSLSNQPTW